MLKGIAKYFDFKLSKKTAALNDILIPADKTLNIAELEDVFTGSNIDAKKLREEAWKRQK